MSNPERQSQTPHINPTHEDRCWTRREMLRAGGVALAGMWVTGSGLAASRADDEPRSAAPGFQRYSDLLQAIRKRGHTPRVLGHTPDGSPVVALQAGGKKEPAIFISAGSHSTEHAGVVAAVELLDELETEHQVFVIPCRDPMGLSGFDHVLQLGWPDAPRFTTVEEAGQWLREHGEVLYDHEDRLLVLLGEFGYATGGFYRKVDKGAAFLEPMRGRRMWFPSNDKEAPAAGPLERAYTQIVTPDAEVLHLNRFHDTRWAPIEVRCTRRLMAEIQPRLTFDLHEYGGDDFWMSARKQRNDEDELWELRMAREAARAVAGLGVSFPEAEYSPGSFFEKLEEGVFWLNPQERGEGLNLVDFAARRYGPGFTVETGMRQDFRSRVQMHKTVVQTAVRVFEQRYA